MIDITVYTAIIGNYDLLNIPRHPGRYLAFTDSSSNTTGWERREPRILFDDPTRNARLHKLLSHQFINSEWSLWIDGNLELLVPPEELVEKYKDRGDFITFKAFNYNSVYTEAENILKFGLSDPDIVRAQVQKYKEEGFPGDTLSATGAILRKNTPTVSRFNNFWWSEMCRYSRRDQLSIDYTQWKLGIKYGFFDGNVYSSPEFVLGQHLKKR